MYSQNNEDHIIKNYFGNYVGTLLDIGANDGITLSNSRLLIENGWQGVLVEPSANCVAKLQQLYINTNIQVLPYAVSNYVGKAKFWESGKHLSAKDHSLISTIKENELKRWKGSRFYNYTECETDVIDVKTLLNRSNHKTFDFISIDAEGEDITILKQLNLSATKLLCIEWNGNYLVKQDIQHYCKRYGLQTVLHQNHENLLIIR